MKWFYRYLTKYKWKEVVGLVLVTVCAVLNIINPKIMGIIVDDVIGDGEGIAERMGILPLAVTLMIGCQFVRAVIRLISQWLFETCSQDMLYDMRDGVYRSLLQKDFSFYNRNRTGDLMSRQTGDMMAIRHFVAYVIYSIYENVLLFVIALVMIFSVDWRIGIAMMTVLPISAFVTYLQSKSIKPKFMKIRDRFSSLNAFAQENISGNRVVRAFAKEDYEIEKFDVENAAYRDAELDAAKVWTKYVPVFEVCASMLTVILMLVGGIMCVKGAMTLGDMVIVNSYLWMLNMPLRMFGWLINDYQRFTTSVLKIYTTVSEKPKITNPSKPKNEKKIKGEVEFKDVSYNVEGEPILDHVSFKVRQGETIGILGATGSGKTTIMNLICRFYDVTDGAVLVDGTDVRDMELHTLRDGIGLAMQDVFLFSDTIEGNIAYGDPDCTLEQVKWAAKMADADGFIGEMTDGYDTVVGERGIGLSGGQKQRIALARAILKKPAIVILDDTTSAVDMETESQIQKDLKLLENETVFIIAQRISSLKDADMILVVENGRITQQGTHKELVEEEGYYKTVYEHQLGNLKAQTA
ncbi:MAG: ABC transporter ATP-binding protein [Lachnospiraceae bacterium]|nr:ABC transporter ATP-binding protein [Lachnospiraceae bacterium]MBP5252506.1 ABC transporter ATP-binding protein [Lachnospiraceae bacterium]MBP5762467.1 ABC transporter ATP-binding protein [Lachnospiraceae bacterium]